MTTGVIDSSLPRTRSSSYRKKQDHSIPGATIQVPIPPPPPPGPALMGMDPCYRGYNASNANLDCSGAGMASGGGGVVGSAGLGPGGPGSGDGGPVLAGGMGIDDQDGNINSGHHPHPHHHQHPHRSGARVRALNQVLSPPRRSLRYRSSSQPLMKASSLIIGVIAALIIGFIVLSPLFHILLP